MRVFRFILLAIALVFSHNAMAQIKILPKERIDSIANPPLAPNAGNVAFEREMITAEFALSDQEPRTFEYGFVNLANLAPTILSQKENIVECLMMAPILLPFIISPNAVFEISSPICVVGLCFFMP